MVVDVVKIKGYSLRNRASAITLLVPGTVHASVNPRRNVTDHTDPRVEIHNISFGKVKQRGALRSVNVGQIEGLRVTIGEQWTYASLDTYVETKPFPA